MSPSCNAVVASYSAHERLPDPLIGMKTWGTFMQFRALLRTTRSESGMQAACSVMAATDVTAIALQSAAVPLRVFSLVHWAQYSVCTSLMAACAGTAWAALSLRLSYAIVGSLARRWRKPTWLIGHERTTQATYSTPTPSLFSPVVAQNVEPFTPRPRAGERSRCCSCSR